MSIEPMKIFLHPKKNWNNVLERGLVSLFLPYSYGSVATTRRIVDKQLKIYR